MELELSQHGGWATEDKRFWVFNYLIETVYPFEEQCPSVALRLAAKPKLYHYEGILNRLNSKQGEEQLQWMLFEEVEDDA